MRIICDSVPLSFLTLFLKTYLEKHENEVLIKLSGISFLLAAPHKKYRNANSSKLKG